MGSHEVLHAAHSWISVFRGQVATHVQVLKWCFYKLSQGLLVFTVMFTLQHSFLEHIQAHEAVTCFQRIGRHVPRLTGSPKIPKYTTLWDMVGPFNKCLSQGPSMKLMAHSRNSCKRFDWRNCLQGWGQEWGNPIGLTVSSLSQMGQWQWMMLWKLQEGVCPGREITK